MKKVYKIMRSPWTIFAAMILGLVVGLVAPGFGKSQAFIGDLFVKMLRMGVVPLIFINESYLISYDIKTISILLMLGIIHTGFAYCLYFDSINTLSPIKIAIIGYVEPVMSVLIGALFLNESMDIYAIIGAILILGSAIISELFNTKL